VYPCDGREIPVGGENLNGPFGVWRVSVAGLKFRDPENAIWLSASSPQAEKRPGRILGEISGGLERLSEPVRE